MFHRRWLDKITLRSWSFLLFVDSLSSWVHSLQTDSYPSGMNAANWAFPFIFQALPSADTIALLSLLIPRVGSYPNKSVLEWNKKHPFLQISAAYRFTNTNPSKTQSSRLGKRRIFILWAQQGDRGGQGPGDGVVSLELELPTLPAISAIISWSWGRESSFCWAEQRLSGSFQAVFVPCCLAQGRALTQEGKEMRRAGRRDTRQPAGSRGNLSLGSRYGPDERKNSSLSFIL